jgi:2-iminoacetate synthase ThiH
MRPNVEITHTLQGRIKDFAEERDLSLSEAYTELLEAGLDTLETRDQQ